MYLRLEVDTPAFLPDIQQAVLWRLLHPLFFPLRDYHPVLCCFPANFESVQRIKKKSNTTSPASFNTGFSLPYAAFDRLYSQHPNWFLFLPVLRRFSSRRYPSLRIYCEVTFGNSRFNGYLRLAETFRCLSRPSSAVKPSHPPTSVVDLYFCF